MASMASVDLSPGPSNTLSTGLTSTLDEARVSAGLAMAADVLGSNLRSPGGSPELRQSRSLSPEVQILSPGHSSPRGIPDLPSVSGPDEELVPPPPPEVFQLPEPVPVQMPVQEVAGDQVLIYILCPS